MITQSLLLVASLLLLFVGAEGLVRGSASLALRLGLTPLVVGLTVVAFGTSAPELVVSINATLAGQGDIAVGNVVGSNIFNVGIILGITALICPIQVTLPVLKVDAPLMVVASLIVGGILLQGAIHWTVGVALVLGLAIYTGVTVWLARRQASPVVLAEFADAVPTAHRSVLQDILWIVLGLGLLIFGSHLLVDSASFIARSLGVSESIIGLTIIAAGTSMPELATSLLAAIRRQPDIAIGNIVGSNLFNLLGILGTASAVRSIAAPGIRTVDIAVMVAMAVGLLLLMWTGRRLQRWEGGVLLLGYAVYLAALWPV